MVVDKKSFQRMIEEKIQKAVTTSAYHKKAENDMKVTYSPTYCTRTLEVIFDIVIL